MGKEQGTTTRRFLTSCLAVLADAVETVLNRRITSSMLNPQKRRSVGFAGDYIALDGSEEDEAA